MVLNSLLVFFCPEGMTNPGLIKHTFLVFLNQLEAALTTSLTQRALKTRLMHINHENPQKFYGRH